MEPNKSIVVRTPNPKTRLQHRREVLWQITVPLLVVILLLLGLVGLVVWSGIQANPEVRRWADISVVWLVFPALIGSFLFLLIISAITFGVVKLIQIIPGYAHQVQDFFLRIQVKVEAFSDRLVKPVIKTKSVTAGARRLRDEIVNGDE